jgi:hypothetical protein
MCRCTVIVFRSARTGKSKGMRFLNSKKKKKIQKIAFAEIIKLLPDHGGYLQYVYLMKLKLKL